MAESEEYNIYNIGQYAAAVDWFRTHDTPHTTAGRIPDIVRFQNTVFFEPSGSNKQIANFRLYSQSSSTLALSTFFSSFFATAHKPESPVLNTACFQTPRLGVNECCDAK